MSDQELKDLVASLAVAQKQLTETIEASQKEYAASQKEYAASEARQKEEYAASQKEYAALDAIRKEELAASKKEVDKQFKQTQKQLGEMSNKWGTFAEGMAINSIEKILFDKFQIPVITRNLKKRMNGETIEMDAFGYENSTINTAVIVEIKSHLRIESVEQIERIMSDFPKFFPDHAGKKLYGVMACVDASDEIKNVLRKKGIYLAVMNDDIFELHSFKNFTPKDYSQKIA